MTGAEQDLLAFPRPTVAVDLVVLTLVPSRDGDDAWSLGVVVQRHPAADGRPRLPGRFVRERETVHKTVATLVSEKLAFRPRRRMALDMIDVFDDPDRDARGWVLSLSYATTLSADDARRLDPAYAEILPVHGPAARGSRVTRGRMAFDHDVMVTTAVRRLRRRYERAADPRRLLRAPYTMTQLRRAHEAVLDAPLKRDTFNRRMADFLQPVLDPRGRPVLTSETVGRPAQLFEPVRRPARDPEAGPFPLPRSEG